MDKSLFGYPVVEGHVPPVPMKRCEYTLEASEFSLEMANDVFYIDDEKTVALVIFDELPGNPHQRFALVFRAFIDDAERWFCINSYNTSMLAKFLDAFQKSRMTCALKYWWDVANKGYTKQLPDIPEAMLADHE